MPTLKAGFSLVELMIVVAILGILAAVVVPEFQGHSLQAKEAAAKEDLHALRTAIELYAVQHNDIAPGYPNDDTSQTPSQRVARVQLVANCNYLSKFPRNPFNGQMNIKIINNDQAFLTEPLLTNLYGWVYKPATKTIKLNWSDTDSQGTAYFDY